MNCEILFGGKICNFIWLYHSPSQSSDTFEDFAKNLNKIANKSPYLLVVLGNFNVKSSNWYKLDKTTYESSRIAAITSQFGLQQLIKEPTDILTDWSSCIDLLINSQPNLVMESGVHSSLLQKLSSSNNICKDQFQRVLSSTIWTLNMALSTCKRWSNSIV